MRTRYAGGKFRVKKQEKKHRRKTQHKLKKKVVQEVPTLPLHYTRQESSPPPPPTSPPPLLLPHHRHHLESLQPITQLPPPCCPISPIFSLPKHPSSLHVTGQPPIPASRLFGHQPLTYEFQPIYTWIRRLRVCQFLHYRDDASLSWAAAPPFSPTPSPLFPLSTPPTPLSPPPVCYLQPHLVVLEFSAAAASRREAHCVFKLSLRTIYRRRVALSNLFHCASSLHLEWSSSRLVFLNNPRLIFLTDNWTPSCTLFIII